MTLGPKPRVDNNQSKRTNPISEDHSKGQFRYWLGYHSCGTGFAGAFATSQHAVLTVFIPIVTWLVQDRTHSKRQPKLFIENCVPLLHICINVAVLRAGQCIWKGVAWAIATVHVSQYITVQWNKRGTCLICLCVSHHVTDQIL